MSDEVEKLRERLQQAEAIIEALKGHQVDAVIGDQGVLILRLSEVETQLQESEERLSAVMEQLPLGVGVFNCDGRLIFGNSQMREYVPKTMPSHDLEQMKIWRAIDVEGASIPVEEWPGMRALRGETVNPGVEFVYTPNDEQENYVLVSAAPFRSAKGEIIGVICVTQDITERKRMEEQLRVSEKKLDSLVKHSKIGIHQFDLRSGRYVFMSNAQEELTGFSMNELIGMSMEEAAERLHPDDRDILNKYLERVISGDENVDAIEYRWRVKSGEYRWFRDSRRLIRDENGKAVSLVGNSEDITEQKWAEAALKEADRRKDEFLAMLGHELRNPLTALAMAINVFEKEPTAERWQWAKEMIGKQADQLQRLIDDLLDVSRITLGKIELKKEPVNLNEIMRSVSLSAQSNLDEKQIELTISTPPSPVFVCGDSVRLQQIFSNLINNAVKFTDNGGKIWFTAEPKDDAVVVRCRDTGVGIAQENLSSIFETFKQIDTELNRGDAGLGMGLALVKNLVEMHGGSVSADSEGLGWGSEFTVTLPTLDPSTIEEPSEQSNKAASVRTRKGKHRILIAEDNIDLAKSFQLILEEVGHEVQLVGNGNEVIALAQETVPEVMIVDIGLPGCDGYSVVEAIRKIPALANILLIGVSGYKPDANRSTAGFDHYLMKPVNTDHLLDLIEEYSVASEDAHSGEESNWRVMIIEDNSSLGSIMLEEYSDEGFETILVNDGKSAIQKAGEFLPHVVLCDYHLPDMKGPDVAHKMRELEASRSAYLVVLSADPLDHHEEYLKSLGFDTVATKPLFPDQLKEILGKWKG